MSSTNMKELFDIDETPESIYESAVSELSKLEITTQSNTSSQNNKSNNKKSKKLINEERKKEKSPEFVLKNANLPRKPIFRRYHSAPITSTPIGRMREMPNVATNAINQEVINVEKLVTQLSINDGSSNNSNNINSNQKSMETRVIIQSRSMCTTSEEKKYNALCFDLTKKDLKSKPYYSGTTLIQAKTSKRIGLRI